MVDANETFAQYALDVFERKHSNALVVIQNPKANPVSWVTPVHGGRDFIYVQKFSYAMKMLKYFGHLIKRMNIDYNYDYLSTEDPKEVNDNINLYCADTLTFLNVMGEDGNLFAEMEKPFKAVEKLILSGPFKSLASSTLSFSELVPALRELSLYMKSINDQNSIVQSFPELEELSVSFWYNAISESIYEQFLRQNSQIKKLSLSNSSRKLMRITNQIVPDITYLNIRTYHPNNEPGDGQSVVFKHVTNLTYESYDDSDQVPDDVFFEKLTEISIRIKSPKHWVILVERNPNLHKLKILGPVYKDQFDRLNEAGSNLIDVQIQSIDKDVSDDSVLRFVRAHKNANRIYIYGRRCDHNGFREIGMILRGEGFGDIFDINAYETVLGLDRLNQE